MPTRAKPNPEPLKIACPTCGKMFTPVMDSRCMPFCSDRCKLVDLGRWMNEEIGLPHIPSEDDEEEEIEQPPQVREWRFE